MSFVSAGDTLTASGFKGHESKWFPWERREESPAPVGSQDITGGGESGGEQGVQMKWRSFKGSLKMQRDKHTVEGSGPICLRWVDHGERSRLPPARRRVWSRGSESQEVLYSKLKTSPPSEEAETLGASALRLPGSMVRSWPLATANGPRLLLGGF
ncbi:unnamed protein product [Boreogadus saida]